MIKIGGQFSGVGAFDQALKNLNVEYTNVYQAEWDKYARTTYLANHEEPCFYIEDVYDTPFDEITQKFGSLDIFMSSAPCQAFSIAGKRAGKNDEKGRGILFFQSLEFIRVNQPRYFIFENVKGLLSDDKANPKDELGRTFNEWINLLGGKSVNGTPILFPYPDSVAYHVYWKVINALDHGVAQNRERVFIVGIRDDSDNNFQFPKEEHLDKVLKDYLETFDNCPFGFETEDEFNDYMERYFLSDENIDNLLKYNERQIQNNRGFSAKFRDIETIKYMDALKCGGGGKDDLIKVGTWRTHEDGKGFREMKDGNCPTIPARAREDGSGQPVIKIKKVVQLNPSTESGGVQPYQQNRVYDLNGVIPALQAQLGGERSHNILYEERIRRLTTVECFRLMGFPDSLVINAKKAGVSETQLYKQAGNSIVVKKLQKIIKNLLKI